MDQHDTKFHCGQLVYKRGNYFKKMLSGYLFDYPLSLKLYDIQPGIDINQLKFDLLLECQLLILLDGAEKY